MAAGEGECIQENGLGDGCRDGNGQNMSPYRRHTFQYNNNITRSTMVEGDDDETERRYYVVVFGFAEFK